MKIDFYELCDAIENELKKMRDITKLDNPDMIELWSRAQTVSILIDLLDYAE